MSELHPETNDREVKNLDSYSEGQKVLVLQDASRNEWAMGTVSSASAQEVQVKIGRISKGQVDERFGERTITISNPQHIKPSVL